MKRGQDGDEAWRGVRALLQRRACDTSSRNVATRCHAREAQRARRVSNTREEGALHWSSRGAAWCALERKFDETNFCSTGDM